MVVRDKEAQRVENEEALLANLEKRSGMKIDGTININTFITAGTLLISVALAYAALDKRLTVVEETGKDRSARVEMQLNELKQGIKEINATLNAAHKDRQ